MKMRIAVAVIAMTALTANAQQAGGKSGNGGPAAGGQGGQQHQRPSPEQLAGHLMEKFDADKSGKLEVGELTKALEELRAHRPQGGGQGGQQHHAQAGGNAQGGHGGQQHAQAGGGGQQGAGHSGTSATGDRPTPPPADKVAAQMIEKFAADKKGLTQAELVKALEAHRPPRGGQQGGGQHGGGAQGGGHQGPPPAEANQ